MRSGGAAHKLKSAASLKSQRIFLLPHYRYPFTVYPLTGSFTDSEPSSDPPLHKSLWLHDSLAVVCAVNGYTVNGSR